MFRKSLLAAVAAVGLYSAPVNAQAVPIAGQWKLSHVFWNLGSPVTAGTAMLCLSNDVATTVTGRWLSMANPAWHGQWRMNRDTLTLLGVQSTYSTVAILELQPPNQFFGHYTYFFQGATAPNSNGNVLLNRISRFCDGAVPSAARAAPSDPSQP